MMEGKCLCGAVTVTVGRHAEGVSVCHCSYCRRWTGLAMGCLSVPQDALGAEGPVRAYRSTPFAERAWCGTCGTHLWIRNDGSDYDLMPGLFAAADGLPLVREVYADRAASYARFAADHPRVTAAVYEETHPFVEGGAP